MSTVPMSWADSATRPSTRRRDWMLIAGALFVLVLLTVVSQQAVNDNFEQPLPLWLLVVPQLGLSVFQSLFPILCAWGIGYVNAHPLPLRQITGYYLLSQLTHLLSGVWKISVLRSDGFNSDRPYTLNLNLFDLGGWFGQLLSELTMDELFHLTLFSLLVSRGSRKHPILLPAVLLIAWVVANAIWLQWLKPPI